MANISILEALRQSAEASKNYTDTHGGGGGSTVTIADNPAGGVDLTVNGTTKTLAEEESVSELNNELSDIREVIETGESLKETIVDVLKIGAIHGAKYGNHIYSTNTAYSSQKLFLGDVISFNGNAYKVAIVAYNADGSYKNVGVFFSTNEPFIIEVDGSKVSSADFYCAEFRKTDNSALSNEDLININATINKVVLNPAFATYKDVGSCYVSLTGSDNNTGAVNNPFATIQKAIDSGFHLINVEVGLYTRGFVANNVDGLTILPYRIPNYNADTKDTPMIIIDGGDSHSLVHGISLDNCRNIVIEGVHVKGTSDDGVSMNKCFNVRMFRCKVSDSLKNGVALYNVDGVFEDCEVWSIGNPSSTIGDGYNIHGYGNTNFINCSAHDCNDDGISHHEGSNGLVDGGEFYNCGKGGVSTPTHGSYVDVRNVYAHDNNYGLYISNDNIRRCKAKVSNSVFKSNRDKDIYIHNCDVIGWNNIYDSKLINGEAVFTEF